MNFKKLFFGIFLLFMISGLVSRAFGYKLMGGSWPGAAVTFYSTGGNSTATFDSAFVEAMNNWNGLSNFVYTSATGYADPCADPNNYGPPYKSGYSFVFSMCSTSFGSGTLAVNIAWTSGTTILQAGTVFNTAYTWDVHNGSSGLNIDFRRVATHELGHALGLDHDNTYSALMNTTYSGTVETPQTDDINGLVAIYGGSAGTTLSAPSGFSASASGSAVTLSWSAVSGASGYKLYYGTSSGAYIGSVDLGNVTSKTLSNVGSGTYYLALKAYNSSSTSGYSSEVSVTVGLSAPSGFSASASGSAVTLRWSAVSGASGYKLYYGTSSGAYIGTVDLGNVTSKTFSNVGSGTYYLALTAYSSSTESNKGTEITVRVGAAAIHVPDTNTCPWAGDGVCDDGGPGSSYSVCDYGTDFTDCGAR